MKKIIKCHFQSCKETIEIDVDVDVDEAPEVTGSASVLTARTTFGHSQYRRVPFAPRDEHKLSGKPWTCPYHDVMISATLGLTGHEERLRQVLVGQLRAGKVVKREGGWYEQAPPQPVPERIIREDDGTIRTHGMMRWWTDSEMIDHLNGEPRHSDIKLAGEDDGESA